MELRLERRWRKDTYTIGRLYIDGEYFCNTLEDKDRGLKQSDSPALIKQKKVYGETAIPTGKYNVRTDIVSPKYAGTPWYKKLNGGKMPRLESVPGFEGILIHPGNTAVDTLGCILVGKNTKVGQLTSSRDTFATLYRKIQKATTVTIEIV